MSLQRKYKISAQAEALSTAAQLLLLSENLVDAVKTDDFKILSEASEELKNITAEFEAAVMELEDTDTEAGE